MSNAASIMTKEVVTVASSTPIREYLRLIKERPFSGFPVVDAEGFAVGLISHSDVLRGLAAFSSSGAAAPGDSQQRRRVSVRLLSENVALDGSLLERFLLLPVSEVMTLGIQACRPHTPLVEVCETMSRLRIHRMVVTDEAGKVRGIISAMDLVQRLGEALKEPSQERESFTLRNLPAIEESDEKEESD